MRQKEEEANGEENDKGKGTISETISINRKTESLQKEE